jgi:hypothetical protein
MLKLYVLVRGDLKPSYRMVQGMHAVAEHMKHDELWSNGTLVVLKVKDRMALMRWYVKLQDIACHKYVAFYEPDLDGQMTSIAVMTSGGEVFRKLPLA